MIRKVRSYLVIFVVFHKTYVCFFVWGIHIIVVSYDVSFLFFLMTFISFFLFWSCFFWGEILVLYALSSYIENIWDWMLILSYFRFVLLVVFHASWISWSSSLSATFPLRASQNTYLLKPLELDFFFSFFIISGSFQLHLMFQQFIK